ncbi:serine hydrolase [Anaerocolumna sp. AGMB13025]|uniref:serine hydrolase domain-containing protein n=1 Tax=Anaerocolumna sp. AGMB13025 TaxID=3039116 RepID=UPI00241E0431|nr:serine hydrolase domain-containing protein [Anaerocolumna sp. AGMB13025]WFR55529.1 serine hydrolase [Anaerocolumna sp. AGMB13025]
MLGKTEIGQIEKTLRNSIDKKDIAGGNLLVIKGGEEILYKEDGYADLEHAQPIKRDSIFRLYSMSKPVTAAAVMILVERGEIDLYEPVSKYLPGFKNQLVEEDGRLVAAKREMIIKDLLSMTSGLVYGGWNKAGQDTENLFRELDSRLFGDAPMSTVEAMNKLGQCTLCFHPGDSWQYGTSADVLGALVEVVSGIRFGEFLKKEIFTPLGMEDTGFFVPVEKRERLVKTYAEDGNGGLKLYTGNHLGIIQNMDRDPAFESGGAGLVSTIDDYAKFAQMLIKRGTLNGVQILRPRTVNYLTTGTLNANQQKSFDNWLTLCGHSYGNLMRVMTEESQAGDLGCLGEYGWDGWLGAYFCNCPKEDITILFMMQKTDAGTTSLTRKLRNIILSSI